ncbi:cytochrome P450, partial [Streptomyces sp. NPDC005918]|uniref:cytochrome P450 n=1 Tax=Streptomyces sp. NPDC005918 TaxID=3155454 RepID=UPI0034047F1A
SVADLPEQVDLAVLLLADPLPVVEQLVEQKVTPAPVVLRRAVRPVTVAGTPLPAGAVVACLVGAAGRDPARFAEPDRYDVLRTDPGHLATGTGRHACLGAELACHIAEYGLRALLDALPGMVLAPGFGPEPRGLLTRGPRTLLVRPG